jgi:hypothetical protein
VVREVDRGRGAPVVQRHGDIGLRDRPRGSDRLDGLKFHAGRLDVVPQPLRVSGLGWSRLRQDVVGPQSIRIPGLQTGVAGS